MLSEALETFKIAVAADRRPALFSATSSPKYIVKTAQITMALDMLE